MQSDQRFLWLLPLALGAATFLVFFGLRPLDPANLQWWGEHGDPLQAWLGWTFFRQTPWTLPPGLNPAYGLELNNSIIYTDSIPPLAFIFKLFSPWLPQIFQYGGYWLLLCFLLQAWFGWKLMGLATQNALLKFLGCCFFLFMPFFIFRMDRHLTLVGHFLPLAALYLCFAPQKTARAWQWLALLCICALIHAYLLFMAGLLWAGCLVLWLCSRQRGIIFIAAYAFLVGLCVIFCCWLVGYFSISPGGAGGFGLYKMNLLGLLDSDGKSALLRDLPGNEGEYEGFAYLGAGALLLVAWAIPLALARGEKIGDLAKRYWPLIAAFSALFLLAITNAISFGKFTIEFPRPEFLERWLQVIFRASGRFIWPLAYSLLLLSLALIVSSYKKGVATALLIGALGLQIYDTFPLWGRLREMSNNLLQERKLVSEIWQNPKYKKIRVIPFINMAPDWKRIGLVAALNGKATNGIYASRADDKRVIASFRKADEITARGDYEPDTIYVLDDEYFKKAKKDLPGVFAGQVDGLNVIAVEQ